jgi:polyphenol oxidase
VTAGWAGERLARVLRSSMLRRIGVPHGFSTRLGGVSGGMFASLNFGNPGELRGEERDPPDNIAVNYRVLLEEIGAASPSTREVVEVHQVHEATVHVVRRGEPARVGGRDVKADAIITDDPGRVVAVRVADCAPVLLASADGGVVAAVHAGWRGVIAGVAPAACEVMQRAFGARTLFAAIGPCISGEHFEVGEEVAAEFERVFPASSGATRIVIPPSKPLGRPHVDLKAALTVQLHAAGVDVVETLPHCTFAGAELFFSHRRERGKTGRMVAVIGPK